MPLRALDPFGGSLHSFEYDEARWAQLKAVYRKEGLRMPCCDAPAIPKTSSRGAQFFAHAYRGECTSAPESIEHLWCKQLIARAAQGAGWKVTTELPGQTPEGESWVADVHCQLGAARVVFEVQVSSQSEGDLCRRQSRYRASGVRSAWFYSSRLCDTPFRHDRDLPAFVLSSVEIGKVPHVLGFDVSLPAFVEGMLMKRLRWVVPERNEPVHVEVMKDICWACKRSVWQVFGHIKGLQVGEPPPEEWLERFFTVAQLSEALEEVQKLVSNKELRGAGLNTVMRVNKPTNWPYSNGCRYCGTPQNNHYVGEKLRALYYYRDECDAFGLVPFDRIRKGAGRWVFDANLPDVLGERSVSK